MFVGLLLGCGGPHDAATEPAPEPEPSAPVTEPSPPVDPPAPAGPDFDRATSSPGFAEEEALALACDGPGIRAALVDLDLEALADPSTSGAASLRLMALWERSRGFTPKGAIDPAAVESLVAALTVELGHAPPDWWVETLASGKRRNDDDDDLPFYDDKHTDHGDRRGPMVDGPGHSLVRPNSGILEDPDGQLAYDLSVGRLGLGPVPERRGTVLELARARAGTTVYLAQFSAGSGGFRFPLTAISYRDGEIWEAVVCGPDRKALGGLSYMIAEIVVLEPAPDPTVGPGIMQPNGPATGIAVFTAEGFGVALDVFDPETGTRTLAWSSDLWFSR